MSIGQVAGSGGTAFDVTQRKMAAPLAPQEARADRTDPGAAAMEATKGFGDEDETRLVQHVSEMLNESARWTHKRLRFMVHEDTERLIVQVLDAKTDELIREIPPEEMLNLAARIHEMIGLLIDEVA